MVHGGKNPVRGESEYENSIILVNFFTDKYPLQSALCMDLRLFGFFSLCNSQVLFQQMTDKTHAGTHTGTTTCVSVCLVQLNIQRVWKNLYFCKHSKIMSSESLRKEL